MNKDFDGAAWAANHDRDFQALITRARRKANANDRNTKVEGNKIITINDDQGSPPTNPKAILCPSRELDTSIESNHVAGPPYEDGHRPAQTSVLNLGAEG